MLLQRAQFSSLISPCLRKKYARTTGRQSVRGILPRGVAFNEENGNEIVFEIRDRRDGDDGGGVVAGRRGHRGDLGIGVPAVVMGEQGGYVAYDEQYYYDPSLRRRLVSWTLSLACAAASGSSLSMAAGSATNGAKAASGPDRVPQWRYLQRRTLGD